MNWFKKYSTEGKKMNLSSVLINRTPVIAGTQYNTKHNVFTDKSKNRFQNIFSGELNKSETISVNENKSGTSNKIKNIKEKIASNYYFKKDISDLVAEKLLHAWGQ